jgi:hypothetical protein
VDWLVKDLLGYDHTDIIDSVALQIRVERTEHEGEAAARG